MGHPPKKTEEKCFDGTLLSTLPLSLDTLIKVIYKLLALGKTKRRENGLEEEGRIKNSHTVTHLYLCKHCRYTCSMWNT